MSHHYSGPDYGFPRGDATATMYRGLKFTFSTPVISPWTRRQTKLPPSFKALSFREIEDQQRAKADKTKGRR